MEVKGTVAHLLGLPRAQGAQGRLPSPGSRVTATVQRYLGKGIWLLDLDGTRVEARSRLSLVPGQRLLATVKQEGSALLLVTRERSSEAMSALLRSAGLQDNATGRALISLLLTAGAPARPELLDRLATALRRRNNRASTGRFEAEAVARGFRELPEELGELIPSLLGFAPDNGSRGERRREEGSENKGQSSTPGDKLKSALLRASATGDHPLQLYNHRARLGSGWIALPIGFTASEPPEGPERKFQGLLHLYLGGGSAAQESWTLDLSDGEWRYTIACRGGKEVSLRVLRSEGVEEDRAGEGAGEREAESGAQGRLADLLRGAGYTVSESELPFDGIEFKDHSDLQEGIDLLQ